MRIILYSGRSQWPRDLRRSSAAFRLLRSWVRISPGAWIFVCCECCVLSGRGLGDELITRPEESYRLWCVVVCDLETSGMRRPWPALGRSPPLPQKLLYSVNQNDVIWIIRGADCLVDKGTSDISCNSSRIFPAVLKISFCHDENLQIFSKEKWQSYQ